MTYNGKDLTVATVEHLARAFREHDYVPPPLTNAYSIFRDNHLYRTKDLTNYLDQKLGTWR